MGTHTERDTERLLQDRNTGINYDSCLTSNYLYVSSQDFIEAEEEVKGSINFKSTTEET